VGLVLVTVVLATLVGRILGGRIGRLAGLPYRGLPLLGGAAAAYLAGWSAPLLGLPARWTYAPGLAMAGALALAFSVRTRTLYGAGLVGAGLLANALVVAVNGGMPVSAAAVARAGMNLPAALADPRQVLAGAGATLRALGAVVPVPLPVRPAVASVGDLLVLAGLAELVVTAMLPRDRGRQPGPVSRYTRTAPAATSVTQTGPTTQGAPAGQSTQAGHVRVLGPRLPAEDEALPRAGPT
jgi:hypothetical protein